MLSVDPSDDDDGDFGPRPSHSRDAWLRKASQPTIPDDAPFSQALLPQVEPQEEEEVQELCETESPTARRAAREDVNESHSAKKTIASLPADNSATGRIRADCSSRMEV